MRKFISCFIFLLFITGTAHSSSITIFTDKNVFNDAVGVIPVTIETFTDTHHFPISTGILNSSTNLPEIGIYPGDIQPGVTYSTTIGTGNFFNIDAGGGFEGGLLDGEFGGNPNRVLTITFDNEISAFGFDTNLLMWPGFDITIHFAEAPDYFQNIGGIERIFDLQFFGFKSDETDITSVIIDGNRTDLFAFALDNFVFTNDADIAIPEPSTLLLLGSGLIGLGVFRKKFRKK